MSLFLGGLLVLLLCLNLIFKWPRRLNVVGARSALLQWYQSRQNELLVEARRANASSDELVNDLEARVLEEISDEAGLASESEVANPDSQPDNKLLIPLLVIGLFCISTLAYWQLGAGIDVLIREDIEAVSVESSAEDVASLIERIEQRLEQSPDNGHYWALSARYHMSGQRYADAARAYHQLIRLAPGDATSLALAAQAEYLRDQRQLSKKAQQLAERALQLNPLQPTALGLLGSVFHEQQRYEQAIIYWQRLLDSGAVDSAEAMVKANIVEAKAALGIAVTTEQAVGSVLNISVSLVEDNNAAPTDTVFVFARPIGERMPLAVKRLRVSDLPAQIKLTDQDAMVAQRTLSAAGEVAIIARVSPAGDPGVEGATYEAVVEGVKPAAKVVDIELVMRIRKAP